MNNVGAGSAAPISPKAKSVGNDALVVPACPPCQRGMSSVDDRGIVLLCSATCHKKGAHCAPFTYFNRIWYLQAYCREFVQLLLRK